MHARPGALLASLILSLAFLLPHNAQAIDQKATIAHLSFHISHPAKKYDAKLLQGGAEVIAHFDAADLSKTSVDATFQADYFNSDNEMRDSHMLEVLEAIIFPTITWKATAIGVTATPVTAGKHEIRVKGPLTVHGQTHDLEIPVTLDIAENGLVTVDAVFSISLESFEIERPSLVFVRIADEVPIKVHMVFPAGPELLAPPVVTPAEEAPAEGSPTEEAIDAGEPKATPPAKAAEHEHAPGTDPNHSH